MSSLQRTMSLLALGFALFASAVSASKGPQQFIRVHNETAVQIGIYIGPPTAAIYTALSTVTNAPVNFVAAGGQIVNSGASATDGVGAGTQPVLAADFSQPTTTGGVEYITENVAVAANQTVDVYVKPNLGAYPAIYFSATP